MNNFILEFKYFRDNLSIIEIIGSEKYEIAILNGPFLYMNEYNNQMIVEFTQSSNGDFIEDTFTYLVSTKNNDTIGVIEYSFSYQQNGGGSVTFLSELNGYVNYATGIFKNFNNAKVNQTYDNITIGKPRFIKIFL
jgi:hypothetical protein